MEAVRRKGEALEVNAEKMARFQSVMNHIIGQAMDANMERISKEITKEVSENVSETLSENVSENVTDRVMKEVEYLLRVNDEKEEERFKQLDETIRAYQKNGRGRAEAAATKMQFFKRLPRIGECFWAISLHSTENTQLFLAKITNAGSLTRKGPALQGIRPLSLYVLMWDCTEIRNEPRGIGVEFWCGVWYSQCT